MNKEFWIRKAHRYLGLFVGIQLLLWVVSGLYFTWNDIDKVRGAHMTNVVATDIRADRLAGLDGVLRSFRETNPQIRSIERVELRLLLGQPVYEISFSSGDETDFRLVDAVSGELMPLLDEATAVRLAQADFAEAAEVQGVELLRTASGHAEYRGRDLPVYRVTMKHPDEVSIYVSARRGMVTARRNSTWRVFDFFWMLHTMDFETRDDFNHVLIKLFSVLGLITVLSGFLHWAVHTPLFRKR